MNSSTNPRTTRREFAASLGGLALASLIAGTTLQLPRVRAQEEPTLAVPLASKPLGPEDIQNGNWLKSEYWEDSLEVPFSNNNSQHNAYSRWKWGELNGEEYCNILVDAVTDTAEKPFGDVALFFDTYNLRYEIKDPSVPHTPGYYSLDLAFVSRGGPLENIWANDPTAPGIPFPSNELFYNWSRGPSPIANNDEARLKDHVLYGLVLKKKRLTSKNNEIGTTISLAESSTTNHYIVYPSMTGYVKTSFPEIPIPEFPLSQLILLATLGGATFTISRRKLLGLQGSGD